MSAALAELLAPVRSLFAPRRPRLVTPESPGQTYDRILERRQKTYAELRSTVAGLMFLRTRLTSEISERRAEVARLHAAANSFTKEGDHLRAGLALARKERLLAELRESEEVLSMARAEARAATDRLFEFGEETDALSRERTRTVTTFGAEALRRSFRAHLDHPAEPQEGEALERLRRRATELWASRAADHEIDDLR